MAVLLLGASPAIQSNHQNNTCFLLFVESLSESNYIQSREHRCEHPQPLMDSFAPSASSASSSSFAVHTRLPQAVTRLARPFFTSRAWRPRPGTFRGVAQRRHLETKGVGGAHASHGRPGWTGTRPQASWLGGVPFSSSWR